MSRKQSINDAFMAVVQRVARYRHDGPGPDEAPQVLVIHALTGSADAAGDWWEPLIGDGRALDTRRVGVLCANLLGGRYGTTGPTSLHPRTGRPYGPAFPSVSVVDQAEAQWRLLDALGIGELALAVGCSLGGMIALEVALARPDAVKRIAPIAAPAAIGPMAIAWNHLQLQMIEHLGLGGLSLARQLAMTTYRSETDFADRFGGSLEADGRHSIVSYLDHRGESWLTGSTRRPTGSWSGRWTATTSGWTAAGSTGRSAGSPREASR